MNVLAKSALELVDDDTYNKLTRVWLQHGKTWQPFYLTFSTTPDKNIFENILLGGSFYFGPAGGGGPPVSWKL